MSEVVGKMSAADILADYKEMSLDIKDNIVQGDGGGLRFSKGKPRYDLFPPDAYEEIVRVYTRGAEKYAENNWLRGMKWGECLRALKSHLTKWEKGATFDDELTDCRHLAMVAWNAIALMVYEMRGLGEDNIQYHQHAKSFPEMNTEFINKMRKGGSI